ncbi:alpha-L-fucosidase [Alkalicoccobacillus porphyridii]|uniref:alpha-L-fucosidase n=1 Tax=Alkalicoccobacillus porphyridii TaxID=2597270 RepID=A0A554A019_9BACI|nr:alpha-L-fucosidase [Alkalicoccobacillus porphyridii]TSB47047.1 alpha-L-fucosidase [Alkalicoccobacillus porphyridii]
MTQVKEKQGASYIWPESYGNPEWLLHDRFGMFIHWGLYSLAARHEWVMNYEHIHPAEYNKYFTFFEPDLYNPKAWAKTAKEAGMKYVVLTTKHHEGFALWDSELTEYKATNTPIQKDLLAAFVEAFRAEGLKIGFYHSLIDWYHPEFPVDCVHPQREDESFKLAEKDRDISVYRAFLHGQVKELLTNYGKVDYLWFDFSYKDRGFNGKGADDWDSEGLEQMIFELQPEIILNNRLDLGRGVITPEQFQPQANITKDGKQVIWEACQTLNGSWGYDRDNLQWKSPEMLIKMLSDTVSKGGNLLLNVGPNGRGEFEKKATESLQEIGEWMRLHSRSIYGASESNFEAPLDCRFTQKGNRLYLHIHSWPFRTIHLKGLAGKIEYAQFLHDASEVKYVEYREPENYNHTAPVMKTDEVVLELPTLKPDVVVPVIELFLRK